MRLGVGVVVEKNWALTVDQCWLQALQFLVHLNNLLSVLLRCNGFAGIQKAIVGQTFSRLPKSDHDFFFFFASLGLGSALELLLGSASELVVTSCHISSVQFSCSVMSSSL